MATKTRKTTKTSKAKTAKSAAVEAKLPVARDIWLASLGFYGRVYDETLERAANARTEANKLFGELVDRGTTVESETRNALKDVRIDTSGTVEERLQKLRDALPDLPKFTEMADLSKFPDLPKFADLPKFPDLSDLPNVAQFKSTRVRELEAEIEGLTKKVSALSRAGKAAKSTRTPARKAA